MPKRILQGVVVSDKTDKTITVKVERRVNHPIYKKIVRVSKKYSAHDENNSYKTGDVVKIVECKPISKTKKWSVIQEEAGKTQKNTVKASPSEKAEAKKDTEAKAASPKKEDKK